jgi:hypothetical protein
MACSAVQDDWGSDANVGASTLLAEGKLQKGDRKGKSRKGDNHAAAEGLRAEKKAPKSREEKNGAKKGDAQQELNPGAGGRAFLPSPTDRQAAADLSGAREERSTEVEPHRRKKKSKRARAEQQTGDEIGAPFGTMAEVPRAAKVKGSRGNKHPSAADDDIKDGATPSTPLDAHLPQAGANRRSGAGDPVSTGHLRKRNTTVAPEQNPAGTQGAAGLSSRGPKVPKATGQAAQRVPKAAAGPRDPAGSGAIAQRSSKALASDFGSDSGSDSNSSNSDGSLADSSSEASEEEDLGGGSGSDDEQRRAVGGAQKGSRRGSRREPHRPKAAERGPDGAEGSESEEGSLGAEEGSESEEARLHGLYDGEKSGSGSESGEPGEPSDEEEAARARRWRLARGLEEPDSPSSSEEEGSSDEWSDDDADASEEEVCGAALGRGRGQWELNLGGFGVVPPWWLEKGKRRCTTAWVSCSCGVVPP